MEERRWWQIDQEALQKEADRRYRPVFIFLYVCALLAISWLGYSVYYLWRLIS